MIGEEEILGCSECVLCKGAGYLMRPVLYIGNPEAQILVIAQNPGSFAEDKFTEFVSEWQNEKDAQRQIELGYLDYADTHADKSYSKIFGKEWLESGHFCYTNAVRCRTPNNETPSWEMENACRMWTKKLLADRRLVVISGNVAKRQLGLDAIGRYAVKRLAGSSTYVMSVYHYAAWRTKEVDLGRELFIRSLALSNCDYQPRW